MKEEVKILSDLLNINCLCASKCNCSFVTLNDLNRIVQGELSTINIEIENLRERKKTSSNYFK